MKKFLKIIFTLFALILACIANVSEAKTPYDKEIKQLQKEMKYQLKELTLYAQLGDEEKMARIYRQFDETKVKYEGFVNLISESNPKADVSSYRKFISDLLKEYGISITSVDIAEETSKKAESGEYVDYAGSFDNAIPNSEQVKSSQVKANPNEEITLTVSSDGPTKDEAVKNALRLAIEQAYGAFVSANTTIFNDELVKDEIVTISNGAIKEYNIISDARKPDGSGYVVTANATVSLPQLVTYAKNHGSECEFAGNTFGMDLKLFKLQKENELKALYNAIPMIVEFAKNNMQHVLQVEEPKIVKLNYNNKTYESREFSNNDWDSRWKKGYERFCGDIELIGLKDNISLEANTLCNKPITRPDGKPSYQKDDVVLKGIEELANDEIVALRFNIKWLPVDEKNTLYDYIEHFLLSRSLDFESFWKYSDQGHDMCISPNSVYTTFEEGLFRLSDYTPRCYFRNSRNDINGWFYTLQAAISKVKNSFQIIDNTGEISDFAPQKIADIQSMEELNTPWKREIGLEDLNSDVKQQLEQEISDIGNNILEFKDFSPFGGINYADFHQQVCYSFPDKLYKAYREGTVPGIFCYGGKGIFSRLSIVNTSEYYLPSEKYPKSAFPAWEVVTLIPSSDIGKYSSFKIVKE